MSEFRRKTPPEVANPSTDVSVKSEEATVVDHRAKADVAVAAALGRGPESSERDALGSKVLRAGECDEKVLRRAAYAAVPEDLHGVIGTSEVLKVEPTELYNDAKGGIQRPAAEGDRMAVTLRLTQDMEVGTVHYMKDREPRVGRWFALYDPSNMTPAEARERFVLPVESTEKHAASFGVLKAGTVITISELGARSFAIRGAEMPDRQSAVGLPLVEPGRYADGHTPPLGSELPVRSFQVEVAESSDPNKAFVAERTQPLKENLLH